MPEKILKIKERFEMEYREMEYKLGQVGPAGGIVFTKYEYQNYKTIDRILYLEAIPANYEFNAAWGLLDKSAPTSESIGATRGKHNTEAIVAASIGEESAAGRCINLTFGGYKDWFLPDVLALERMYEWRYTIGGFKKEIYWSSTEGGHWGGTERDALIVSFINGESSHAYKASELRVRAVREFMVLL